MQKPTKKKLRQMLSTFSVQQKVVHPPVMIQKNLDSKIKGFLTSQGMLLLTNEINNIIERQKMNMLDKNKLVEEQDFRQMKKNLKIYGKNKKQYRVQKIIKFGPQAPQPLKNIVKVHENKFTIAKEHNIILSQKIDAIIQEQDINNMRTARVQHLQSKLKPPLIRQLRRFGSTHNIGRTQRFLQIPTKSSKGQSSWTQRTVVGFDGCRVSEEKSLEKYKRDKRPKLDLGGIFNFRGQRNSVEGLMNMQKGSLQKFRDTHCQENENHRLVYKAHVARKLKRKGVLYN